MALGLTPRARPTGGRLSSRAQPCWNGKGE